LLEVLLWEANCSQHIPRRFEAEDVALALTKRDERIATLEGGLAELYGETPIVPLRKAGLRTREQIYAWANVNNSTQLVFYEFDITRIADCSN
jgi:hypothetical protein